MLDLPIYLAVVLFNIGYIYMDNKNAMESNQSGINVIRYD